MLSIQSSDIKNLITNKLNIHCLILLQNTSIELYDLLNDKINILINKKIIFEYFQEYDKMKKRTKILKKISHYLYAEGYLNPYIYDRLNYSSIKIFEDCFLYYQYFDSPNPPNSLSCDYHDCFDEYPIKNRIESIEEENIICSLFGCLIKYKP